MKAIHGWKEVPDPSIVSSVLMRKLSPESESWVVLTKSAVNYVNKTNIHTDYKTETRCPKTSGQKQTQVMFYLIVSKLFIFSLSFFFIHKTRLKFQCVDVSVT